MSRIAGLVVRPRAGAEGRVLLLLEAHGLEVVKSDVNGFAVVFESPSAAHQEAVHERLVASSDVEDASLVFQSSEVSA